jgi:hypothetical protein
VRPLQQLPRLNRQGEHAFDGRELPVDCGVRVPLALSVGDVRANVRGRQRRHASSAEPRLERAVDNASALFLASSAISTHLSSSAINRSSQSGSPETTSVESLTVSAGQILIGQAWLLDDVQ